MEPPTITPAMISTQREVDALFSESKLFTPANAFTAKLTTGLTVAYSVHATPSPTQGHTEEEDERVLFLVGLMKGAAPLIDLLHDKWIAAQRATRLVLVAFDSRGFGGSSSSWGFYSTHTLAMDALALMDHLQWPMAHIIGPSWGGMVAQELALASPERVRSLTLMHTSRGKLHLKGATDFILSMIKTRDDDAKLDRVLEFFYPRELLTRPLQDAPETVGAALRRFHQHKIHESKAQHHGSFLHQLVAIKTHFVSDERLAMLGHADFPITVLGGAADNMVPGTESLTIWNAIGRDKARLVYYANVGHLAMVQCASEVAQVLAETIDAATARS